MKKKIASILARTQIHQIEEKSTVNTEQIPTEPIEEVEIITEPEEELEIITEPEPEEELQVPKVKYTLPSSLVGWDGDMIQKNKIFNRCAANGIITKRDATDLKEKSIILDSIIPKIIVDESVASSELFEKLREQGYDGMCLGRGQPDEEVFRICLGKNMVLVIEENEFYDRIHDNKIYHVPIFISTNPELLNESVGIIVKHMQLFEKIIKLQS